jgi:catechol 2,3-dioxygenase-like lactoylglutathione lyase family enzyme
MPVLNHHIVSARNKEATASYFAELLGFDEPVRLGEFAVLRVSDDTTLDFVDVDPGADIPQLHYAFLVTEREFDEILGRIERRSLSYWSDPLRRQPDEINEWDDGRGVYFDDPNGHLLEILTRPYGSGGTTARKPNPLILPVVGDDEYPR